MNCLLILEVDPPGIDLSSAKTKGPAVPDTMTVTGNAMCPRCGTEAEQSIRCQWGIMPGPDYPLGDAVSWLRENGSVVPPFSVRIRSRDHWVWNMGHPEVGNVIVLELYANYDDYWVDCAHCSQRFAGRAVVVLDGIFTTIRYLLADEMERIFGRAQRPANIAVIREDGTFEPKPDWFDHVLDVPLPKEP